MNPSEPTGQQPEDKLRDWFERAFEAGCNHFAYHESNRTEYSPDFEEWYDWYKDQIHDRPTQPENKATECDTMPEGWIKVDGKVYVPVEEASQLAANQCLHGIHGDDGGNSYCSRIKELEAALKGTEKVVIELRDYISKLETEKADILIKTLDYRLKP